MLPLCWDPLHSESKSSRIASKRLLLVRRPEFDLNVASRLLEFAFDHIREVIENLIQIADLLLALPLDRIGEKVPSFPRSGFDRLHDRRLVRRESCSKF